MRITEQGSEHSSAAVEPSLSCQLNAWSWLNAAHALARKLTLVSNNRREFGRVPGLDIENWSRI